MLDDYTLQNGNHLVFVYGTLRHGCRNNPLLARSRRRADYRIIGYRMVDVNGFYPAVIRDTTSPYSVLGELYECTPATLAVLDNLEGFKKHAPHLSYYHREPLDFDVFDGTGPIERWVYPFVYLWKETGGYPEIIDGDWNKHIGLKG